MVDTKNLLYRSYPQLGYKHCKNDRLAMISCLRMLKRLNHPHPHLRLRLWALMFSLSHWVSHAAIILPASSLTNIW
jgi:hypothetical protein